MQYKDWDEAVWVPEAGMRIFEAIPRGFPAKVQGWSCKDSGEVCDNEHVKAFDRLFIFFFPAVTGSPGLSAFVLREVVHTC
jgi:hypothetical protein